MTAIFLPIGDWAEFIVRLTKCLTMALRLVNKIVSPLAASKSNQVLGMIRRNITYKEKILTVPCIKQ